jgi:hypothetical protein
MAYFNPSRPSLPPVRPKTLGKHRIRVRPLAALAACNSAPLDYSQYLTVKTFTNLLSLTEANDHVA